MQRLFRLGQPGAILLVAILRQPRGKSGQTVVARHIAEQRIDRGVKEVRQLHQRGQLRLRKIGLPFVNRADRHAQRLCKLLLRQMPRAAKHTDVFRQRSCHFFVLLIGSVFIIAQTLPKRKSPDVEFV